MSLKTILNKYKNLKKRYQLGIILILVLLLAYIFCLPSQLFDVPYSTVVTDRNGLLLGARIAKDEQWRFPASDSLPDKYKACAIQFEDKYFNYHWGVNPLAVLRAAKQNISDGRIVSGASTITMQTIRLMRGEKRTFGEKLVEAIWASRLELSKSKDEILSLYASHAPMGGNVVGVEAASWRYFGHDVSHLSWAEAATLAVLPNSPALMHFGKNRDALEQKRNRLLEQIYMVGSLDSIDYQLAITEPLPPHPYALPNTAPHMVSKLYMENGGRHLQSSLEKYQQERLENILIRWNSEFRQNGINNIAALIIDAERNEVIAYCGNVHFNSTQSGNQVDVIQAPRSTGSILKPFLYAAMIEEGVLLPDELLPDVPVNINGFAPKNFSLQYDGAAPASEALARSLNIPFVIALRRYSVPKFYDLLKKTGLNTLTHSADHYGLSLILGGCEGTLWEVTRAYLQMVQSVNDYNNNKGKYFEHAQPRYLMMGKSEKLVENSNPVYKAGSAWITLNAMTNVNRPEEIDWRSIPSMQKIAWKTGTSWGGRDGWAVGANSKYVVGVWVGNSDGEGRPGLTGARTSGQVLFDIFNSLPSSQWFDRPSDDLTQIEICKESGLLRGVNCPDESIEKSWLPKKASHANSCKYHKLVHLSEDLKYQVYKDCAGNRGIVHKSWFVLPPSWAWYYRQHHNDYSSLPDYSPECSSPALKVMEFIYPHYASNISIPKQLDGSNAQVVFEIAHNSANKRVFWHLNGRYIGETQGFHSLPYTPSGGENRLIVVDEDGNKLSILFYVGNN